MSRKTIALYVLLLSLFLTPSAFAGVVDISPSADAQVVQGYPTTNYGAKTNLYVQSANAGYKNERAWLKFDLTGRLPEGAVITSVKLRLYCFSADTADAMTAAVHGGSNDAWTETGITWDTQPAFGTTALSQVTMTANTKYLWYEWDVTNFVKAEAAGDLTASFMVKAATESDTTYRTYAVDAREYSSALAPRLRIEYTGGQWSTDGAVTILHMNDVHSRLLPHDFDVPGKDDYAVMEKVGGAAYFASKMLALKAEKPDALILDAGDISEGNPLGDLRGNGGSLDVYNLIDAKLKAMGGRGIDAVVVGNHDVRAKQYLDNLKNATFPVISVNVYNTETGAPYFKEYVTVTVGDTKVGILGYTNDESSYLGADVTNVEVKKCVWEDTDAATINIKDKVAQLRDTEGCDIVILLAHMGHSRLSCGDDAVIEDSGGVNPPEVVIAGHWHTWDEKVWQPAQLNGKTLFAEAASYMQYIGELTVSGAGKYMNAEKHIIRDSQITPDGDVQALIHDLNAEYEVGRPVHHLDDVVGYSAVDLMMDKDKWWSVSEYPWNAVNAAGAWICDAMVWKAKQLGYSVDLALQTGGSIRRDIAKGAITYNEIYEAYPWSDNTMATVSLTGQEVWDVIGAEYCGASLSAGWVVNAEDGVVKSISYNGAPLNLSGTYTVALSSYMALHEDWAAAKTATQVNYSIREAVVDFTAQHGKENPLYAGGIAPRYVLDTELAGGFKAVVTMVDDAESQPYYESVFIRLIGATDDTLVRRNRYGLAELVNSDGSINPSHQFAETMLYRSHLGFRDGWLKPGDIIEVRGEGGFYSGNPQFVDQEGIQGPEEEMKVLGHDETLSKSEYMPSISAFWDEAHENHYVKFYAKKTGTSTVQDAAGTTITIYQPGGLYAATLPGVVGNMLELTGVNTMRFESRHFRLNTAKVVTNGYFPSSAVNAVAPYGQTASSLTLSATAADSDGSAAKTAFYYRYAADGLTWGAWTLMGTDTTAADGWSVGFSYPNGYGYYEFYSVATDNTGNVEDAPVLADARVRYWDGVNDAPGAAANPGVPDGSSGVGENATLSVTVSDSDADTVTVEFWAVTDAGDVLIDTVSGVATGRTASVAWTGLSGASAYSWFVTVDDGKSSTQSPIWSFTTSGWTAPEDPMSVPATGSAMGMLLVGILLFLGRTSPKRGCK